MKPGFALSLSFDGISLLHRAAGGWRLVGDVALDVPDLGAALAELRAKAEQIAPGTLACKLIIPNDQIKYLSLNTGNAPEEARLDQVRTALDGATPYAVADLAFDLSQDAETTHVAAVALETLREAESFARDHAFNPVSFVSVPGEQPFLGEPYFGATHDGQELNVEPDGVAVVVIGPAMVPPSDPEPAPDPAPPEAAPASPPPTPGFSTRRGGGTPEDAPGLPVDDQAAPQDLDPVPPAAGIANPSIAVEPDFADPMPDLNETEPQGDEATSPASPVPVTSAPSVSPLASDHDPGDETGRMTIFGARPDGKVGGKPRYMGLALTAGLLVFLLIIAAWAAVSSDFRLFGTDEPATANTAEQSDTAPAEILPQPGTAPNPAPVPDQGVTEPDVSTVAPDATNQPPELSATDTAVLDALYSPADATADNVEDEQSADETLLQEDLDPAPAPEQPVSETARYAATGIWQRAPVQPDTPGVIGLNDLYTASIDRTDLSQDAVALPDVASLQTDDPVGAVSTPVAPDTMIKLNDQGLVEPTPEGTLNPDGIVIYQGRPPIVPPIATRPDITEPEVDAAQVRLAGLRPRLRPDDLVEQSERSQLGGRSLSELARVRPRLRPEGLAKPAATPEPDGPATTQAVAASIKPKPRPANFAETVNKVRLAAASTASINNVTPLAPTSIAPATVSPKIPSTASVARQATVKNSINLRKVNLIGVYGSPSNRRALVRLPSGRYKKVKIGDSVDGGRVVAIGDSELRYQKGGRNLTLKMPKG
jgi:hypothetical protein